MQQLVVTNLSLIRGERVLFERLSFTLSSGTLLYVTGENGAGKSSLLRVLAGLLTPDDGDVSWGDTSIYKSSDQYRNDLLFLGHYNSLKDDLSALENLNFSMRLSGASFTKDQLEQALGAVQLQAYRDEPVSIFSQGQKRRVSLSKLWLSQARIWLLDEPFVALDAEFLEVLRARILQYLNNGGIVVLATHQELDIAARHVQRLQVA